MHHFIILISFFSVFNNLLVVKYGIFDFRIMQFFIVFIIYAVIIMSLKGDFKFKLLKNEKYLLIFLLIVFSKFATGGFQKIVLREFIQWFYFVLMYLIFRHFFTNKNISNLFFKYIPKLILLILAIGYIQILIFERQVFWSTLDISSWVFRTFETHGVRLTLFRQGYVVLAAILMSLYFIYLSSNPTKNFRFYTTCASLAFLVFATKSRAGFFIFSTFTFIYIYINLPKSIYLNLFKKMAVFVLIGVTLSILPIAIYSLINDSSFRGHYAAWVSAFHMFLDHPLIGVGSGMTEKFLANYYHYYKLFDINKGGITETHNFILTIAAENGALGLTSLFLFFKPLFSINMIRATASTTLYAVSSLLLMNFTMNMFMVEFFWIIIALHAAQINYQHRKVYGENPFDQ